MLTLNIRQEITHTHILTKDIPNYNVLHNIHHQLHNQSMAQLHTIFLVGFLICSFFWHWYYYFSINILQCAFQRFVGGLDKYYFVIESRYINTQTRLYQIEGGIISTRTIDIYLFCTSGKFITSIRGVASIHFMKGEKPLPNVFKKSPHTK